MKSISRTWIRGVLAAALLVMCALPVRAQQAGAAQTNIQDELAAIRATQEAILKELQAIRQALASRPAAAAGQPTSIPLADAQWRGNLTAKLVLLEFSDYQ